MAVITEDNSDVTEEVKRILHHYKLKENEYEYIDKYQVPELLLNVEFRLYLCSSDFAVELMIITERRERCLKNAVRMKIIDENPAVDIRLPKRQKKEIKVFSMKEIDILLNCLKENKSDMELPVNLALSMGMRRGEVLGLRFSDVDYEKQIIKIHNNRVRCCNYEIVEKAPKTVNSIRIVNVPDTILKMIKQQETSKLLGHSSTSFTLDTYTHLLEDKGSIVANVMDDVLYKSGRAG